MEYKWYRNGRYYVESNDLDRNIISNISKEYFDEYISIKKFYWNMLCMEGSGVVNLGRLEYVTHSMNLSKSKITSLGKLKVVGGCLNLNYTGIKSLGGVKGVKGNLNLRHTNLTDLGELEHVGGHIKCTNGTSTHEILRKSKFSDQVYTWTEVVGI